MPVGPVSCFHRVFQKKLPRFISGSQVGCYITQIVFYEIVEQHIATRPVSTIGGCDLPAFHYHAIGPYRFTCGSLPGIFCQHISHMNGCGQVLFITCKLIHPVKSQSHFSGMVHLNFMQDKIWMVRKTTKQGIAGICGGIRKIGPDKIGGTDPIYQEVVYKIPDDPHDT